MTSQQSKLFDLVKRWRELDRQQKDLDFKKSVWSREARAAFPDGDIGDSQFANWLATDLGFTHKDVTEHQLRAVAAKIVPDQKTYKDVGGYRQIKKLEPLNARQRVTVLEAAKATEHTIERVIRDRGLAHKTEPKTPLVKVAPAATPYKPRAPQVDHYAAACILARYLGRHGGKLPREIRELVDRYSAQLREVA